MHTCGYVRGDRNICGRRFFEIAKMTHSTNLWSVASGAVARATTTVFSGTVSISHRFGNICSASSTSTVFLLKRIVAPPYVRPSARYADQGAVTIRSFAEASLFSTTGAESAISGAGIPTRYFTFASFAGSRMSENKAAAGHVERVPFSAEAVVAEKGARKSASDGSTSAAECTSVAQPARQVAESAATAECQAAAERDKRGRCDKYSINMQKGEKWPATDLRQPYREFLRACAKTFGEDFEARYRVTRQMTKFLRENPFCLEAAKLVKELTDATEFVRYRIVQAQLNPVTGCYKAIPSEDHIRKGEVIELNFYDPERITHLPWLNKEHNADGRASDSPPLPRMSAKETKF